MKTFFLLATFALSILSVNAQSNTTDEGVVINGVRWATRNVGNPGTFVENPEDYGGYYQWNKGTMDWTENWNGNGVSSWLPVNDPSPASYRIPTSTELQSLLNFTYVSRAWTRQNGVNGAIFTDRASGESIFMPAAGSRVSSNVYYGGSGDYWCSSTNDTNSTGNLYFNSSGTFGWVWDISGFRSGLSIRAVSDFPPNNITNIEINEEKTPIAYYSIMGVQLQKEPKSGIYIIMYDNGTTEKIMKKPQ